MIHSDCNLLYGLLARLFDFASQPAVCDALQVSKGEPGKSLGQLLSQRGTLDPQQRAALDALLRQYLALHGNDAARCLAELTVHPLLRAELAQLLERAEEQIPAGQTRTSSEDDDLSGVTLAIVTPAAGDEPEEAGARDLSSTRFRILRSHAQGGLGEVFVAHDEELRREVALKQLRQRHADAPETRARFMLEAEVTGGLEHPGIVPVYSLGRDAQGRPFYAMRFIRGDSFKQAIDRFHQAEGPQRDPGERTLELRKLLRRFVDVCNAIEYAHSRGIIHRDLKPDNIMLGAFGETLVVDWGLAKPLRQPGPSEAIDETKLEAADGHDTTRTQMGSAVGTPAYMSPEQAAGQLDRLGPASDIYSLGATLYYLLAGRPPVEDAGLLKLLMRVQEGDFPRPREVNARVPTALEAICLKAMALAQDARYPSARALAEDLERWLADESVTAYRAAWHERLARWGRRHRRSVEAAAAALTIISVVSIVAFVFVHRAKLEVETERDEVQAALAAETAARRQARAALEAERAAKNEARRAIDNYVQLVAGDNALGDEQLRPLRRQLLEDAQRYYRLLLDKRGADAHARHDLAAAILRVGRLNNVAGSKEEALKAFEQARAAFQELVDGHPDEPKYRSDLALCYRSLGVLESETGRPQVALSHFRRAVDCSRLALDAAPQVSAYRRQLSDDYERLSRALGPTAAALEAALANKRLWPGNPQQLFAAACLLARCAPSSTQSPAQQALAREADEAAAGAIEEATVAGFRLDKEAQRRLKELRLDDAPKFKAAVERLRRANAP